MAFIETKPITYGTAGADVVVGTASTGVSVTAGLLYSTAGGASTGAIRYYGLDGNDSITGTTHNDTLLGGNGNDTLRGAAGSDQLYGGAGSDTFKYGTSYGNEVSNAGAADWLSSNGDMIMDFQGANAMGGDTIQFSNFGSAANGAKLEWVSNWTGTLDYVQFYKLTAGSNAGATVANKVFWLAITLDDHSTTTHLTNANGKTDYQFA